MRVLIVDDEQPARDKLRRLLPQALDGAALAGLTIDEARDGVEALAMIESARPDVVFLDIQMPEVSGLEVDASLPAPAPLVVFVTAFDQYAVPAFDANAIDYLLKPYDLARLQRALARVSLRLQPTASAPPASPAHGLPVKQLLVSERGVTRVVRVEEIAWVETADNYVVLHCTDQQPLLRQSMTALMDSLGPQFLRCHRRAAVQLSWVDKLIIDDKGDGQVLLRGGATAPLSRQYRAALVACLAGLQVI